MSLDWIYKFNFDFWPDSTFRKLISRNWFKQLAQTFPIKIRSDARNVETWTAFDVFQVLWIPSLAKSSQSPIFMQSLSVSNCVHTGCLSRAKYLTVLGFQITIGPEQHIHRRLSDLTFKPLGKKCNRKWRVFVTHRNEVQAVSRASPCRSIIVDKQGLSFFGVELGQYWHPLARFVAMSKSKRKSRKKIPARERVTQAGSSPEAVVAVPKERYSPLKSELQVALALLSVLTLWSYWPTFVWMESQWRTEPDYSHGYLILPLALVLLYKRLDLKPKVSPALDWGGLSLLALAVVMRVAGRLAYMDFLDGWTLVPWVAGMVWLFCGRQILWWSLPAICFLFLLTPMPYKFESLLSFKLQGVSTVLSGAALVVMGFPAVTEGNTIWMGDQHLMVEEACSGLRIFMGMVAMGYFFAVLSRRSWLDKVVVLVCSGPIAIVVNAMRVTFTGVAYHWLNAEQAHQAHDWLGFLMIFVGAGMLFAVSRYWEELYKPVEVSAISRRRLRSA